MNDFDRDLHARLHTAALPPAPVELRGRLEAIVRQPARDRPRVGRLVVLVAALGVAGTALLTGASRLADDRSVPVSPTAAPSIRIDAGLSPVMTPDEVRALALTQMDAMERMAGTAIAPPRIVSVTATTWPRLHEVDPDVRGVPVDPVPGVIWVVRAEGTFTNFRVPPGRDPMTSSSGYFLISDEDRAVVGFGLP